jgi:hypothetical protein
LIQINIRSFSAARTSPPTLKRHVHTLRTIANRKNHHFATNKAMMSWGIDLGSRCLILLPERKPQLAANEPLAEWTAVFGKGFSGCGRVPAARAVNGPKADDRQTLILSLIRWRLLTDTAMLPPGVDNV